MEQKEVRSEIDRVLRIMATSIGVVVVLALAVYLVWNSYNQDRQNAEMERQSQIGFRRAADASEAAINGRPND